MSKKKNVAEKHAERLARANNPSTARSKAALRWQVTPEKATTEPRVERELRNVVKMGKGAGQPFYTVCIALYADANHYYYAPQVLPHDDLLQVEEAWDVLWESAWRYLEATHHREPTAMVFVTLKQNDTDAYGLPFLLTAWLAAMQTSLGMTAAFGPWFLNHEVPTLCAFTDNLTAKEKAVLPCTLTTTN